jgi:hypothetical protein
MSILNLVLVNLAESDDESPYVTLARQPVESLIEDWLHREELISSLCDLLRRARDELTLNSEIPEPDCPSPMSVGPLRGSAPSVRDKIPEVAPMTAQQQHTVRRELLALIAQVLQAIERHL